MRYPLVKNNLHCVAFILSGLAMQCPLLAQEATSDTNTTKPDAQAEKRADINAKWRADSKAILALVEAPRQFRQSSDDSEVQKKARKKKFDAAMVETNKRFAGTSLSLSAVRVVDVTPEKVFNEVGKQKARDLIAQMRRDPNSAAIVGDGTLENNPLLAWTVGLQIAFSCADKCWTETGRYVVKYEIPVPEQGYSTEDYSRFNNGIFAAESQYQGGTPTTITVKISRVINSEDEALAIKKGAVGPLDGTIKSLSYKGESYSESIEVLLN